MAIWLECEMFFYRNCVFCVPHKIVEKSFQERRYICFDGDLDPVYIENMRTIMDNSKMLTLGNGECIRLENHCAILFEVNKTKIKVKFMMFRSYFILDIFPLLICPFSGV